MSELRKQWSIVQKRVSPPTHWRKYKNALTSWKVGYAEVVAALPRPVTVYRYPLWHWRWYCRLCGEFCPYLSHEVALRGALDHLHHTHGCPSRRTTGEACHTTCVHCHGWQWCATATERSDW